MKKTKTIVQIIAIALLIVHVFCILFKVYEPFIAKAFIKNQFTLSDYNEILSKLFVLLIVIEIFSVLTLYAIVWYLVILFSQINKPKTIKVKSVIE